MTTIIVWLLVAVSHSSTGGVVDVVERFPTAGDCEYVRKHLPNTTYIATTKCVQAKIVKETK